ncbi:class I SAM-dependent methyltransferase [Spongiibacter sp. KMU-158]|uniref:Class I SAM-dependent methyltransferase n=1 Tax=Spongiibacter pelagi TaxID=2760804 RepID=A0A927GXI5_9GAMM|nr:cyclopropane-fatty-acyl-phospholipid synthase family protein [Spongiibacter pelagi]MBD2859459.1 class I SAM-dependent methyltransferase [Spongiibacter pelagi]
MQAGSSFVFNAVERGWVPDGILRRGIRHLMGDRLREIGVSDCERVITDKANFVKQIAESDVAISTQEANEQHYELPTSFFQHILGKHLKYSCCYWESGEKSLDGASEAALAQVCERAQLEDGQAILELGCGWGSLSLWMAAHYPNSTITAVSNSSTQKQFIDEQAASRGLTNLTVITADMNVFELPSQSVDRVVSVEMFEHMRNHAELYRRINSWLKPGGKFFKHIFVHRNAPYFFEYKGPSDWMSRYFFAGGMMPSDDLPHWHQRDLILAQQWRLDGRHYQKTAAAWLENMDASRAQLMPILADTYGEENKLQWWNRWRIFFISVEELFGYREGQEWWVSHYLFEKRSDAAQTQASQEKPSDQLH